MVPSSPLSEPPSSPPRSPSRDRSRKHGSYDPTTTRRLRSATPRGLTSTKTRPWTGGKQRELEIEVGRPLTLKSGGPSTADCVPHSVWQNYYDDDDSPADSSDESHRASPTPATRRGKGRGKKFLGADRSRSAYEADGAHQEVLVRFSALKSSVEFHCKLTERRLRELAWTMRTTTPYG